VQIATEQHPNLTIVSLRGRLDSVTTPAFESSIEAVVASGRSRVLIDCSELRYISSMGIGALVQLAKTLEASGGRLSFAGLTQQVRSVLDMVGLLTIFRVYGTRQEALLAE
jgi:anti-sigma B factor antagonist